MDKNFSYRRPRDYLDVLEKDTSVEKAKRKRVLFCNQLNCFTSKGYPSIFLDERLRSIFFK